MPAIAELQQLIALIAASACAVIVLFIASADALETPAPGGRQQDSAAAAVVDPELETVYFDFDSASLNPVGRETVQRNLEKLQRIPGVRLLLTGHTEQRGSDEYSLAVGERRARAVQQYLVSLGFDPERITVISNGRSRPADLRRTRAAQARNRRVEFRIVR